MKRLIAVVKGTVQGVGYRYFVVKRATALGLTGYALNLDNGDVKVVAEGDEYALREMADLLKRGSFGAFVREVVAVYVPATGEFTDFNIRHDF